MKSVYEKLDLILNEFGNKENKNNRIPKEENKVRSLVKRFMRTEIEENDDFDDLMGKVRDRLKEWVDDSVNKDDEAYQYIYDLVGDYSKNSKGSGSSSSSSWRNLINSDWVEEAFESFFENNNKKSVFKKLNSFFSENKKDITWREAADRINAVRYKDGWKYEAKEDGNFYYITDEDLDALAEYLNDDPMDGYSLWCAAGYGEKIDDDDFGERISGKTSRRLFMSEEVREVKKLEMPGGDTLEIHWDGNAWVSPTNGRQYSKARQAMKFEIEKYLSSSGEEISDSKIDSLLGDFGARNTKKASYAGRKNREIYLKKVIPGSSHYNFRIDVLDAMKGLVSPDDTPETLIEKVKKELEEKVNNKKQGVFNRSNPDYLKNSIIDWEGSASSISNTKWIKFMAEDVIKKSISGNHSKTFREKYNERISA